ncbi:hypothetical protein CEXT_24421 [Caerostris extrusa]|uniref:Uncharacterized protein n=1 Tax=Caerostris extrusa TaxID=172846 RepID=A0AAV4SLE9_CAEEX|nr:hypothetical protein CEXT_24421 [Caerostris extrusa]
MQLQKHEKTSRSKWLENSIWLRDKILKELGIRVEDLTSFQSFTKLLHEPRDPSGLAVIRNTLRDPKLQFRVFNDSSNFNGTEVGFNETRNIMECHFIF